METQLNERALSDACRDVVRVTLWQVPAPTSVEDIIDDDQIARLWGAYVDIATRLARYSVPGEGDPNVVTRAVWYLASERATPTMREDLRWFEEALTILVGLVYPTSAPSPVGAAFMAVLERAARKYQTECRG